MFKKLLALLIICTYCGLSYAKKVNIITSISPLAAITAMIGQDKVEITTLANQSQCPHHYFLKPEQFLQLKKAVYGAMALQHRSKSIELRLRTQGRRVRRVAYASRAPVQGLRQWGIWYEV